MGGSCARAAASSQASSRTRATTGSARRWPRVPPSFLEERRKAALEVYEREPVPTWRRSGFWTTTLRHLRLDELEPRHYDPVDSIDELPSVVLDALDSEELA